MATKTSTITMDVFRTAQEEAEKNGKPACTIGKALEEMTSEERVPFEEALADGSIFGTVISKVLERTRGLKVTGTTVQRHRRGACSCG